ncbi:MAG: 3'(2'),5'-bisphosphate nucleotidase CysQ [Polyangiaceae bacterium]|nr:3'(2'),5'-bisphosphate nucleotidase CysQ [Polyangiaceae bacterium]
MNDPVLDEMVRIAEAASPLILEVYKTDFSVDYKAKDDPVTQADQRANEQICASLADAFPDAGIVAEESDPEGFRRAQAAERIFFVDPLDGTREFVAKNGEFVIMIGLVEGDRATHGVVLAPASGILWAASPSTAAWRSRPGENRSMIHVGNCGRLEDTMVVASRSHRTEVLEQVLEFFGTSTVMALGSAGLKGAAIADASADLYVAPGHAGKRWDSCAVDALVHQAGGVYTDAYGTLMDYRSRDLTNRRGVAACNKTLHPLLISRLADARATHPDAPELK